MQVLETTGHLDVSLYFLFQTYIYKCRTLIQKLTNINNLKNF